MPINLRKDRNRPRSPLAIPTAPSRDQSPPIDELFTGSQASGLGSQHFSTQLVCSCTVGIICDGFACDLLIFTWDS